MNWQETTLRNGTKTPKICRDMFVTDSRGEFRLCEVKNGRMVSRKLLSVSAAESLINGNRLIASSTCFSGCFTYRTYKSAKLIEGIVSKTKAS